MKTVILAGGFGTRLAEETQLKPKPMVEIGGKPLLWHIMKLYSAHGVNEFVICCGYKGYLIKEYFANYFLHMSDVTFDMATNRMEVHQHYAEPWRVSLIDTGETTGTGGRLRQVRDYVKDDDFCFTYGDVISDVDITRLIAFHRREGRLATLTTTRMPGRFGVLSLDGGRVSSFEEKPHNGGGWINGGFFVLSPQVLNYITDDTTMWEQEPAEALARKHQFAAYTHDGFWHPMDTLRDKSHLEELWAAGSAPWKVWDTRC